MRLAAFTLPFVVLVLAGLLANFGIPLAPNAHGATTDTVAVNATVASAGLDMGDSCGSSIAINVVMGGNKDGSCAFTFGSTNDATTWLRVSSSAGAFLTGPGTIADEGAVCANMASADKVGLKVLSVTAPSTNVWGCATSTADTNTGTPYKGIPDTYTNTCASGAMGTANACTLGVGVFETGSNATAGSYTGSLLLDVIG
jgi:hypothetical protein